MTSRSELRGSEREPQPSTSDQRSPASTLARSRCGRSAAQGRQRFTIAHEIGHRALHPGRELILDVPVRVNLRDKTSSMASDLEEIEANAFAAALLMPEQMIRHHVNQLPAGNAANPTPPPKRSPGSSRSAPQP